MAGTRIVLEISHEVARAYLTLTYRWWTSDADPWVASVPGLLGANSGTWDPRSPWGGTALWGKDKEGVRRILELRGVGGPAADTGQPFKAGLEGDGVHHGVGGKIPGIPTPTSSSLSEAERGRYDRLMAGLDIGAPIRWKVISA